MIGGTAIVSGGTVRNSGTLFASGSGSLLEIANGAVVNGGTAEVGNGMSISRDEQREGQLPGWRQRRARTRDDAAGPTAYTGKVSGFGVSGGISHADHTQYIALTSVTSAANEITLSYTSPTPPTPVER